MLLNAINVARTKCVREDQRDWSTFWCSPSSYRVERDGKQFNRFFSRRVDALKLYSLGDLYLVQAGIAWLMLESRFPITDVTD